VVGGAAPIRQHDPPLAQRLGHRDTMKTTNHTAGASRKKIKPKALAPDEPDSYP